jgi:hypothetical protein
MCHSFLFDLRPPRCDGLFFALYGLRSGFLAPAFLQLAPIACALGEEGMKQGQKVIPDEIRIGACADYIRGKPMREIETQWGVSIGSVYKWVKSTGSFKLRRPGWRRHPVAPAPRCF